MMESRVGAFTKLCKLQGRLDLMLSQVFAKSEDGDALNNNQNFANPVALAVNL